MGGRVQVESQIGSGSTFTIEVAFAAIATIAETPSENAQRT